MLALAAAGAGPPPPNPAVIGFNDCIGTNGTRGDAFSDFGSDFCSRFFCSGCGCNAGSFCDTCGTTTSAIGFCTLETGISTAGVGATARRAAAPCPADALVCEEVMRKMFVSAF